MYESDISQLPLPDACVDVVISNAVINLAPDKRSVFREANRVLRSGGRLQFADMVRHGGCTTLPVGDESLWAGCVSGTLPVEEVVSLLQDAGFCEVAFIGFTGYTTSPSTVGALFRASKRT